MKKKDTILVSIDSSMNNTGYAIFKNGKFEKVIHFENKTEKGKEYFHEEKLQNMIRQLNEQLKADKPSIIVIEMPVNVKKNAYTQKELCGIYGSVITFCTYHNCEFNYITPSSWRKWCVEGTQIELPKERKRKAYKKWAINTVKKIFPDAEITADDDAEAILIGIGYIKWFEDFFVKENGDNEE